MTTSPSSSQQPRIAVLIPCYNDGATLLEAIESVDAQGGCELVVVDDGSSDPATLATLEQLEQAGRKVIHQENQGPSAARMTGLAATEAPYVFPLDADDLLAPNCLNLLADCLDSNPELTACWGDGRTFGDVEITQKSSPSLDPWLITYINPLSYAALFRREALNAVGGWGQRGEYEDWDLWMKLAEAGCQGMRVPVLCLLYRVHGQRLWASAAQQHETIYARFAERHAALFAARRRNWRRSTAPLSVRLSLPLVASAPFLSGAARRRLSYSVRKPGPALSLAIGSVRRRLSRSRLGVRRDTLILCYHAVSTDWPAAMSVTPADFEELLRHKLEAGYEPMTLTESQSPDRPDRALVVTFDDAYISTLTHAAPILDRLGIAATLFVPTSYIGQAEPMAWPGIDRWMGGPHEDELKPIDWDQVRSLAERGWEIGSHSHVHPHLTELSEDELDREFGVSRKTIEEQLGTPCLTVAYPYGDTDERVAAAASRAGYELGVAMPSRWTRDHNPMLLPRVGVYHKQGRFKLGLKTSATVRRLRSLLRL